MGNEMGNSNTSGLQEEENPTTHVQGKSLQEATHANGADGENHIVPVAEHKDYHEKGNGFASDITRGAGDSPTLNQISEGREKEENEVHHSAESPEVEVKSNEAGCETSEIQPTSPSKDSKDHENPPCCVDVAQGNHIGPVAEGEDNIEKGIDRLAPDVTEEAWDPHVNQISNERELKSNKEAGGQKREIKEQEETEVHFPPESSTLEGNSNKEVGGETSEIEEQEQTEVQSSPESSTVEENSNNEVGGEMSKIKEIEETEVHPPAESSTVEMKSTNDAAGETSDIEATSPSRDLKDHEKPLGLAYVAGGENHIVPVAKDEDYQEVEIYELTSVVPDGAGISLLVNQISDEREQKEEEINTPAESLEVQVKSNNKGGCEISNIQPTSPSKDSNDHELPLESNPKEDLSQISSHQLERQASFEKEEEEEKASTFDTISAPNDPEPQEIVDSRFDQPEVATVHVDPLVQDDNRSPENNEDILGSTLTYTSEKNGQAIGTNNPDMGESVVSVDINRKDDKKSDDLIVNELASKEVSCEERLKSKDDEVSNGLVKRTIVTSEFPSGVGIKCNGELPIEVNPVANDSPKVESEPISTDKSLNTLPEGAEAIEDCIILATTTILTEEELEHGETRDNDQDPTQSFGPGESVEATEIDKSSVSASESVMSESEPENNEKRTSDHTSCGSGSNEDHIEEAKVAENRQVVDVHINDQNEASAEPGKDSHKETVMVLESGMCTTKLFLTDCKRNDESEEKKVIVEIEGKIKGSQGIGNDKEGRENLKHCMSSTLPLEQEEASLQKSPLSLVQTQDNQQNHEKESKKMHSSNESISELKQESFGELFVAAASSVDPQKVMAGPLVPAAELATKQDLSRCTMESLAMLGESDTPSNYFSGQCAKVETPAFAGDKYQAQETVERLGTESNHNSSSTLARMQKSPSFGLDLRIKAKTEESDRIPLLYQDKTAIDDFICQADISIGNPIAHNQYGQTTLVFQAMPVEEKVVTMERSDSEQSKTPFLGFLNEEQEAHIMVTPQKHDNNAAAKKANTKEVTSASPKSKEKRKVRSSLFANCMCCTNVIN